MSSAHSTNPPPGSVSPTTPSVLVFSAHAADFVWRAGGALALYAARGYRVRILCLSFGERGESQGAWKEPGMTIEKVKEIRRAESLRAATILGAEVRFFDCGDYPIVVSAATIDEIVAEYRALQPALVLTHSAADPYNFDHPTAHAVSLQTRTYAQALGYPLPGKALGAPPVFMFEPHQPEQCGFRPDVLLDVTSAWETKHRAMEAMDAQRHLWEYYTDLGKRRGTQAVRNGGPSSIRYAEAFERVYPQVTGDLS
jgi:4-oxalomesaconate hydratase